MTAPNSERELAAERALRSASDSFYEIVSAFCARDLISGTNQMPRVQNALVVEKLREALRSDDQLRKIAVGGFELCVRALAEMGASDVTIHECGERDMEHW